MAGAVHSQHQAHGGSFGTRVAITPVSDTSPQSMIHAFFTDFAIPKKGSDRAQQSVIMECLHNRHTRFAARRVNRRRDHDPGVMDVDEIWLLSAQHFGEFFSRVVIPDGLLQSAPAA